MQATKFLIALTAASSPAMGLVVPQACIEVVPAVVEAPGAAPTGTALPWVAPPTNMTSGTSAAESISEEPEEPVKEPAEGESNASSIGSSVLDAGISSIIGLLPQIAGGLFGGSSGSSDPQAAINLQGCIAKTQACCNNVQGKSSDSSPCNDNTVIAAFGTNSACAADGDDPVAHATTACKTALGM